MLHRKLLAAERQTIERRKVTAISAGTPAYKPEGLQWRKVAIPNVSLGDPQQGLTRHYIHPGVDGVCRALAPGD
jgi:hypothetical protein